MPSRSPASLLVVASCLALVGAVAACSTKTIIVDNGGTPPPTEEDGGVTEEPDATPPIVQPTDPLVVDLGSVTTGEDVTFDVPAGALGFNIVAEGSVADFDQDRPYGIQRITDPSGTVVHDSFTPDGGTNPTSTAAFDTIASASVPQSENVKEVVPAGTWKVRFGVMGNASAKITMKAMVRIQSSGDGAFHGGKLDLTIHVPSGVRVDGQTIDVTKAQTSAAVEERIATFFAATSQLLGIERGTITFKAANAKYVDLDDNEIIEGFATSTGETDGTQNMHILLSNSIRANGQEIAIGISPGIPGAATTFGRGVSGIIVVPQGNAEQDALTMIHEFGHFIGLNHTTEFDGSASDPLSDTPRCPTATISSMDPSKLVTCSDAANVMFAAGALKGPVALSATQKRVYRGSPIYKATAVAAAKTQSFTAPKPLFAARSFRTSGRALAPVEQQLSLGFCGLQQPNAQALVQQHGRAQAIAELTRVAGDADLAPFIRGRAKLALGQLGVTLP